MLLNTNNNLKKDIEKYENLEYLKTELVKNLEYKIDAKNYIKNEIDKIIKVLKDEKFIDDNFILSNKATVAVQLNEVHPLALGDLYDLTNGFKNLSPQQIACIFSCFTNVSIPEDKRSSIVICNDNDVKKIVCNITNYLDKYYEIEIKNQLDTGTDYTLHYELIDYIDEWCVSNDEFMCKNIIIRIKEEKELFLGEFIKAILKINNIAKEFEKIAESLENLELLEKIKQIPSITLKYVATNQSLYI